MDEPAVVTRGLTKRYGDLVAVDHLDLELHRGEIFGLLGPNGAGKTTTILMLLGLTEPSEGEARVLGLDPTRRPLEVKRRVGYVPDAVGFYDAMTGRQNLRFTARLNGLNGFAAEERIAALLEQVGLSDAADDPVETYSRGMRQRLGIADALVKDPEVLILDEPTVAIDPEGVAEVLELIRRVSRERGATVLLSSHLLHQVRTVCDRVGIFAAGRLVALGRVDELAARAGVAATTLEVSVDGDPVRVEEALRSLPGVRAVERDGRDPRRWVVEADGDPRPALVRALVERGLVLLHLERREEELDALYRRYFHEAEAAGARGGTR
ncbi:MAG TPA: ABC transporter ATP-binding protein [Actinomycetota bacterium]|nr:ABC transporter ATP-binding protein [Actinomycetota bacterium]